MNAWVLSNLLVGFRRNEQKAIARVWRHAFLEWDRLQLDFQYTHEVLEFTLVRLVFGHILQLLGMTTWGAFGTNATSSSTLISSCWEITTTFTFPSFITPPIPCATSTWALLNYCTIPCFVSNVHLTKIPKCRK